jgi:hypothetical protein
MLGEIAIEAGEALRAGERLVAKSVVTEAELAEAARKGRS